jgi:hypothetical protein
MQTPHVYNYARPSSPGPQGSWPVSAGGTSTDYANDVAVDGAGNVTVTGFFYSSTALLGTTRLTSQGSQDVFVAKVDKTGKFLWAVSAGSSSSDKGYGVAADSLGNAVVTGMFVGPATFGTTTLNTSGDILIARLDKSGKWLWATSAGRTMMDGAYGVAVDGSGNTAITGRFYKSAVIGSSTLTSAGSLDIFVARVDKTGKFLWSASAGGTSTDESYGLAVDGAGNAIFCGKFQNSAMFGSTKLTSQGGTDAFIARVDSSGKF